MPLPPDPPEEATLWAPTHIQTPYLGYDIHSSYHGSKGILQVPVCGPAGTPCELIRLHGGSMRRSVAVGARRSGAPPILPALQSSSANEALAGFTVAPQSPALDGDGNTYLYRTSTAYEFYLREMESAEDGFRMGSAPYTTTAADANVVNTAQFSTSIL